MELELSDPWFDLTKRGLKKYEGRVNKKVYQDLKKGDIITFYRRFDKTEPSFSVVVKKVHTFPTFRDALSELDINKVLPIPGLTIQAGVDIYYKYVSQKTQEKEGIVMIEFE